MKLIIIGICISLFGLLFSCSNDIEAVKNIAVNDLSPSESGKDVETIYSKDGVIEMVMKSPVVNSYSLREQPYVEMPKGVTIHFYDSLQHVNSYMKSNYAINYDSKEIMEARNNVEVLNDAGEKLNTELLIWDQKKRIIYSDKFVKITTEDEVLYGDGFESDETFDKWRIKKPKGVFTLKD